VSISADEDAVTDEDVADVEEAVFTLTTDNFDAFIAEHPRVLVEFYAPWCGHCKALAPEYEKAAQILNADDDIAAVLAKVDATEEKDLATKFGVRGFPTLKYFTGDSDNPDEYTGGRTESTIVTWLRSRSLPAVTELSTNEEVEAFRSRSSVVIIGFFDENSNDVTILKSIAETNRESVVVGLVTANSVYVENVEFGSLYLFRDFDEPNMLRLEGDISVSSITDFLNAERFPLIDAIGPENYKDYMDRGLPLVWVSLSVDDEEEKNTVIAALIPSAQRFKGKLSFTWVDAVKYAQHVDNLGITETPGMLVVGGDSKFLFSGDLTNAEEIGTFFDGYSAGTLEAHLKSEDIPETNDEDVFVLVGLSFSEVVGSDKDVFVEYYAPWCGHCKKLAPEYEKVGAAFSDVENVVIAKIDATENDTPEEIKGFPTLIFYPSGTAPPKGTKYAGDRTADAIIDWIKEHATVDVSAAKTEL
jgi:protein disulfide-isomerase A1